jgi:hypothetical protein
MLEYSIFNGQVLSQLEDREECESNILRLTLGKQIGRLYEHHVQRRAVVLAATPTHCETLGVIPYLLSAW